MINQNLPKLYQIDNPTIIKKDPKKLTRKLIIAPQLSPSKLISTVDDNLSNIELNDKDNKKCDLDDCDASTANLKNENNDKQINIKLEDNTKDSIQNNLEFKKLDQLNLSILQDAISELKGNKSRVTKLNLEKIIIKRNSNLNRIQISDFINKCLKDDILEKIKYRDYYGIRFKTSFNKKIDEIEDDEQNESNELNEELDKSSLSYDQESNLDNLSECSSNINNLNDELDEDNDSMYNTKKSALKRCSPTIRYMLRNASDDGVSAADILKSLQAKRLLVLYDLKKMIWLIKTYFVDKGICEQLNNGNFKLIRDNDDDCTNKTEISPINSKKSIKSTEDEIDLLTDEKLEYEDDDKNNENNLDQLIEKINKTSNLLTVNKINEIINSLDKDFTINNILKELNINNLESIELAAFIVKCSKYNLLKNQLIKESILNDIKNNKILDNIELDELTLKKVINALKEMLKENSLTINEIFDNLKNQFKLIQNYNLVLFNDLIRDKIMNEGFLEELSDNQFRLINKLNNEEISNHSDQSSLNLKDSEINKTRTMINLDDCFELNLKRKTDPTIKNNDSLKRPTSQFNQDECFEIHFKRKTDTSTKNDLNKCFELNLKRKIDPPTKNNDSLRRPTSQRKKFKKTLGPDFISLDQSSSKLRNSYKQTKNQISTTTSKSTTIDKQELSISDIDLNETTSIDINVKSDILEEVPTLIQLKEIEMKNSDILNTESNSQQQNELNSDESNEDSNQCKSISSLKSTNSNLENSRTNDDCKKRKYGQFYKAYDVHQESKISKEQFNTLKSLNSYSNGKSPFDWTVDDVATFITNIGFPTESLIFKKEEIDGRSLLLLRRNDVLTGLQIKLGNALKIYAHIYSLQGSI